MEPTVNLFRYMRGDQGTRGRLFAGSFDCHTLELPWRDNRRNISCIPAGEYKVKIRISPKYGTIYHVKEVPNRSYILIHSGNWAGDTSKGYRTHVNGCILLGKSRGVLLNQMAVLASRITVNAFMRHMDNDDFILKIHEAF
jgi:hypothetical protein